MIYNGLKFLLWSGAGSNRRHMDFQSIALPTELPLLLSLAYAQEDGKDIYLFMTFKLCTLNLYDVTKIFNYNWKTIKFLWRMISFFRYGSK